MKHRGRTILVLRARTGITGTMTKILLVEDSTFLRMATERILARAKYEVCTAVDGEEALRAATENKPDIILLDMMLPKLSGPEVLKRLKNNPETADIAVVVLSGLSQKNAERLQKDGAFAFLEKSDLDLERGGAPLLSALEGIVEKVATARAMRASTP